MSHRSSKRETIRPYAEVQKVHAVTVTERLDNMCIAHVKNRVSVIDEINLGDKVVVFHPGTKPIKASWSEFLDKKHRRIRTRKFNGIRSDVFIVRAKDISSQIDSLPIGTDVTDLVCEKE